MIRPFALALLAGLFACAATVLRAAEDPEALARRLGDDSFAIRDAASRALLKLGDPALPALDAAAKSGRPEVRWRAESAARMIRWAVSPELADRIGDPFAGYDRRNWFERERLVMDVAALGGKTALPTLARVLAADPSGTVKRAAARALLQMGPEGLLTLERSGIELLGVRPDDPSLRIQIGNGLLEEGKYEQAAREYRRAIQFAPRNVTAWYNLACALSRLKKIDEALAALRKAIEVGYDELDWIKKDPDLENLRNDKRCDELIKSLEKPDATGAPEPKE